MKKKIIRVVLALCLLSMMSVSVFAEPYTVDNQSVTCNRSGDLVTSYSKGDIESPLTKIQPGDSVTYTVTIKNENDDSTDWYMTNSVIQLLETGAASGGAYTYQLTYSGPGGDMTIRDSDTIGGDETNGRIGLEEATEGLEKDHVFLDTLEKGQSGVVTMYIELDGETQGNDYREKFAELDLQFAVEFNATEPPATSPSPGPSTSPTPTPTTTRIVKTGDETNMAPYLIAMAVSGVLLLVLAVFGWRTRKKGDA